MSQENVEVVRRAFEVDPSGDPAEELAYFDPDVIYNHADEGASHGLSAARRYYERWKSAWEELDVTAEEFIDAGDRVVLTIFIRARGRRSGINVEGRSHEVHTLRNGKIVRVDEFADRAEALKAAGLSE